MDQILLENSAKNIQFINTFIHCIFIDYNTSRLRKINYELCSRFSDVHNGLVFKTNEKTNVIIIREKEIQHKNLNNKMIIKWNRHSMN